MGWNPNLPQPGDIISGSPPGFQANWGYIQNTMQVDHLFNNAVPANDGHHNVIQMPNQGGDPAVVAPMNAGIYSKNIVGTTELFYTNTFGNVFSIPYGSRGTTPITSNAQIIFTFTTQPSIFGFFTLFQRDARARGITCQFSWDGATVTVYNVQTQSGTFSNLTGVGASIILTNSLGSVHTAVWQYIGYSFV